MLEFRFHGRGGQGVVMLSKLVARLYFQANKHVKEFPKFGVERRGAPVEGYVRVDDSPIDLACQIYHPDVAVVMAESILDQVDVTKGMSPGSLILVNSGRNPQFFVQRLAGFKVATVDASAIALSHGLGTSLAPIANTTLFGAFGRLMGFRLEEVEKAIQDELKRPEKNARAAAEAFGVIRDAEPLAGAPPAARSAAAPFRHFEDLPEFAYSLSNALGNKTGSWRSQRPRYVSRLAPCNARCPAGNDVRGFLEALARQDAARALEILLETSPFPAVCGRVCPHPCEDECNRNEVDEPVAVMASERFAAAHGGQVMPPVAPSNGLRVAIVGSGPAGLSAAWQLARGGYHVIVYEAAPHPGGMLTLGIPAFRLPREVLKEEISRIVSLGVEIACDTRVGRDVPFERLRRENDAVLIAVGQHVDREVRLPGESLEGVHHGLDFLRHYNLGHPVQVGERIVVIGGGNTAVDVAGVCLRRSRGRDVSIVYRRTKAEMPAIAEEIAQIVDEGVKLSELTAPVEFVDDGQGRVRAVVCERMKLGEPDGSGRPRPVPIEGSRFVIECDQVVLATGQLADLGFAQNVNDPAVFVCGDAGTGEGTVAAAIGSGRKAALAIRSWLKEAGSSAIRQETPAPAIARADDINYSYVPPAPRSRSPRLPAEVRLEGEQEVVGEIEDGCREAARCISCGTCNGCDNCFTYCPEPAVSRNDRRYAFDLDYCKGCGICFEECPRGAIEMREEL